MSTYLIWVYNNYISSYYDILITEYFYELKYKYIYVILMRLSRIIHNNKKEISIKAISDYIDVYMSARARRENKRLNINLDSENKKIYVDIDRIKQVLINLLDNAFKFTEAEGTISISFSSVEGSLKIIVQDDGCGISEEDLPRVKEKFYKGKNAKSKNGIGLSICDEIVKLHDGEIFIESEEGKGTLVTITLPVIKEEEANEKTF